MTEPSRKRPRPTDPAAPEGCPHTRLPSGATKKDDEFWFDDGNLIIVAQDVEFCVYKGPLVKHSPVFRDMLTLPQPAEAGELGHRPVVSVPEHPTSFRHFLREFMAGSGFQLPGDEPVFEVVCAVIRLGHKYEVDRIVEKGLGYLKKQWLDNYSGWSFQANLAYARYWANPHIAERCISVVNIARLTDTPSLLRPALFECCTIDPQDLLKGHQREDGVCERLTAEDVTRVLLARTELVKLDALTALRIFRNTSGECYDYHNCTHAFQDAISELTESPSPSRMFSADPKRPSWFDCASKTDGPSFCDACLMEIRRKENEERSEMWNMLPSILDIPEPPRPEFW
ncbi:hypothetical protein OH76DRAFT_1407373 [Lentinus brumalis]|uniref:BTB domain-containing protein n=1 Tax=Lentinus brumalis TaxID=2498619 RepID=A0A371D0G3_9APHY|nr:hypothetical protein OH76DRAFT_1407373 [Polyporus brumalis]